MRISDWSSDVCSSDLERRPCRGCCARIVAQGIEGGGLMGQSKPRMAAPRLSALVVAHDEEARLADCLDALRFADEIVVVLDRCTDGSKAIAARYTDRLVEGAWPIEGERRNAGIAACTGDWIFEVDADRSEEHTSELQSLMRIPYAVFCLK